MSLITTYQTLGKCVLTYLIYRIYHLRKHLENFIDSV